MPCILTLLALAAPRFVVVLLWLTTGWFRGVFNSALWPILGFFFLPTTLLWYTAVHHWFQGQWSLWPVVGLIAALLVDLSPARHRRHRRPRREV